MTWLKRLQFVLIVGGVLAFGFPISGLNAQQSEVSEKDRLAHQARLELEQRLHDIGWKLIAGNAAFCPQSIPSVGIQLHDMASYSRPSTMRQLIGIEGNVAILTAAKGSPGAEAGLSSNDEVMLISGVDPNQWEAEARRDWHRTKQIHDWIDQRLSEDDRLTLTLPEHTVELEPINVCASRFELGGSNKRAIAEGERVIIGTKFPGFNYAEEEFAAAIAHELAHNFLQHRLWLDANGRKRSNIRLTEREADRLMPWLLANAGYDPRAAIRFMERWGPKHDGGLFRSRTHDGWDERVEFISAEVAGINALVKLGEAADWSRLFQREIKP